MKWMLAEGDADARMRPPGYSLRPDRSAPGVGMGKQAPIRKGSTKVGDVYRYINFDQIPEFVETAEAVER